MCEAFDDGGDNIASAVERDVRALGWVGRKRKKYPGSPSSSTLSQTLRITSQFSLVKFSSVALTIYVMHGRCRVGVKLIMSVVVTHQRYHRKGWSGRL